MCNRRINADITFKGSNRLISLDIETRFIPWVSFNMPKQPDDIEKNYIYKDFTSDDVKQEEYKSFSFEIFRPIWLSAESYFAPYLRMWPGKEERNFILNCAVDKPSDLVSRDRGDLLFKIPSIDGVTFTIDGLDEDGMLKDVILGSVIVIHVTLDKDVDRSVTGIFEKPLVVLAVNGEEQIVISRIHLSIAPKDIFSEAEIQEVRSYFANNREKSYKDKDDCITSVRNGLRILFSKPRLSGNAYTMYTFMTDIQNLNHVHGDTIEIDLNKNKDKLSVDILEIFSDWIKDELGFHYFTVSWVSCYHTQSLIIDNCDLSNVEYDFEDQLECRQLHKRNLKSDILAVIQHWSEACNYSTLSKIWKITRILIIALMLTSCGMGSRAKQEISADAPEIMQDGIMLQADSITIATDSVAFEAADSAIQIISPDSLMFNQIRQFLLDAGYYIAPEDSSSYAKTTNDRRIMIIHTIGEDDDLAANMLCFKRIRFDTYNTKKPMLWIDQFVFREEGVANSFIDKFIAKINDQPRHKDTIHGTLGRLSKATQAGSTIYVFSSWFIDGDDIIWGVKANLDPIILESMN